MEWEVEREEALLHGKLVLKGEAESSSDRSGSESSSSTSSLSVEPSNNDASNGSSA